MFFINHTIPAGPSEESPLATIDLGPPRAREELASNTTISQWMDTALPELGRDLGVLRDLAQDNIDFYSGQRRCACCRGTTEERR